MIVYINIIFNLVDGSSDDLDEPIKEIFLDRKFVDEHHLCSINSINWARILVQVRIMIDELFLPYLFNKEQNVNVLTFTLNICRFRWLIMPTYIFGM